jgi:hypothetical protein
MYCSGNNKASYLRRVADVVIGRRPAFLQLPVDGRRFQSIAIKVCMNQCDM